MKVKIISDKIYSLSNVLSIDNFYKIEDEFNYNPWIFNKKEIEEGDHHPICGTLQKVDYGKNIGDNLVLINIGSILKFNIENILQKNIELKRINTNIQFFGQNSSFHEDGFNGSWTLVLFCSHHWNTSWGGEFVVQNTDSDYSYVPYIPNNGVLIPGQLQHIGMPPNRLCTVPRLSIAFTYQEV